MRYHSSRIKHYISIRDTPQEIAKKLILKTCEVEEIIERKLPEDVVIGKVASIKKHPEADKLVVCELDCGAKWVYTICTWGENVVENSYVPVAIPGCYLPAIDLKIEPRTMRWIPSNGMICSKGEVGILEDEDQHWIWTLQYDKSTPIEKIIQPADFDDISDADLGVALKDKYPWLEAYIFDVDNKTITNRPDLTGHFWLAWELQAMYAQSASTNILRNKLPTIIESHSYTSSNQLATFGKQHQIPVRITCDGVRVYTGIHLTDCQVVPSTFFTRMVLRDCDLTPRSNWVDAGNTFMMLTGQPIHCFDADTIDWWVIVRYAQDWEKFTDLMDVTHSLSNTDIVIADTKKILALAGIIGGKESAISEKTKNVFVEIAHFDPIIVRKTGTRLGVRTDAEMRYEKQINAQFTTHAIAMFLDFLQYAKKDLRTYTMEWLSLYTSPTYSDEKLQITIDREKISQSIYGDNSLSPETAKNILINLWYGVTDNSVLVPWRRGANDMHGIHDITEEVIRIHGYETIESKPLHATLTIPQNESTVAIQRSFEETLVRDFHMTQVETYPWLHEKHIDLFWVDTKNLLSLQNPTAPELMYLRDSMIYGLLDIITKNAKTSDEISIFDIGKVWTWNWKTKAEDHACGIVCYNNIKERTREKDTWFPAKQAIETVCKNILPWYSIQYKLSENSNYHTKKQATIYINDVKVGKIVALHPSILQAIKLDENSSLTYASISLKQLAWFTKTHQTRWYETLQDQILRRDFNFLVDKTTNRETLKNAIQGIKEILEIKIFDIYAWESLPEWKKAIAFSCKIMGDGTMKTEEINKIMDAVIIACEKTGAKLK